MYNSKMHLTEEELSILRGDKGETLQKVMESVVKYGEVFGATKLTKIDGPVHLLTSFGIPLLKPVFGIMDELIKDDLKTEYPFTLDPRPIDYENVKANIIEKIVFSIMYGKQKEYEEQLKKVGLAQGNPFSCASYLDEIGNIPKFGQALAWA